MFEKWVSWDSNDLDVLKRNADRASRLGLDGIALSIFLPEPTLAQLEYPDDRYTYYTINNVSIFKFIEAGVFSGIYPEDYISRNFKRLKDKCRIIGDAGIKVKMVTMEPQFMTTSFYEKHPHLKGPRVDHPARSKHSYYAPCLDKEEVLSAYREGTKKMIAACPAIAAISIFTNDSGAGICWCQNLYSGKNGPEWCKDISVGERVGKFFGAMVDGARDAGAETIRVNMEPHGLTNTEIRECAEAISEGGGIYFCARTVKYARAIPRSKVIPLKDSRPVTPFEYKWEFCLDFGGKMPPFPFYMFDILASVGKEGKAESVWLDMAAPTEEVLDINTEILGMAGESIPHTEPERIRLLEKILAEHGLEDCAPAAISAWRDIDSAIKVWPQTGMGFPYYRFQNLRLLVRPIVPLPAQLTEDEYDYFLKFIMLAKGPETPLYPAIGRAGFLVNALDMALDNLADAVVRLKDAAAAAAEDSPAHSFLDNEMDRVRYLRCFFGTEKNCIRAQGLLGRYAEPRDGDGLRKVIDRGAFLAIMDDEINNAAEWMDLLKKHPEYISTVPRDQATMYAYGDDILDQLQKKIDIMEKHKPDVDELFNGWEGTGTEFADGVKPTGW